MNDNDMTPADLLLQAAEDTRRNEYGLWPGIHPSRSMKRRDALTAEVEVRWLDPAGRSMAWLRESFPDRRPEGEHVRAVTLDSRGRVVRAFTATDEAVAVYARGLAHGSATCPLEAVAPWTIQPGQPAAPAHAFLAAAMWANLAAQEGTPIELPPLAPDPAAEARKLEDLERAFWRGLMPEPEGQANG